MAQRSFAVLGERGVLEVAGADRVAFLQGLVSNDVTRMSPERAIYAALLTAQGKYLHDFFIAEEGETLYLDAEAARLEDLRRRLAIYKLRSKVTIAVGERFLVAAGWGDDAAASLGLTASPGAAVAFAGGIAFVDPRLAALGLRFLLPRESGAAALDVAGFAPAEAAEYDRLRLSLGVADGSRDLEIEKSILLEAGFDELGGVDWKKGCYMGQELTARTKYRGLVKKRLFPVTVTGPLPAPGTLVTLGTQEAGEMRSGRDGLGIALLRLDAVAQAEASGMALTAGAAELRPHRPDWAVF